MLSEVQSLRDHLATIIEGKVPPTNPNISTIEALTDWDNVISFLNVYVAERREALIRLGLVGPESIP